MNTVTRFHGARLKEAREAAKLTQKDVAARVGVKPQAISQFEKGQCVPASNTVSTLARTVGVLPSFFAMGFAAETGFPFFRSLHSATKGSRLQTQHQMSWLVRMVNTLEQHCPLPEVCLPEKFLVTDPATVCDSLIAEAASATRQGMLLPTSGPIPNLVDVAERAGVVVVRRHLSDAKQDAASVFPRYLNRPVVMLNMHKASAVHSRFDLAHEIGHMVLHRKIDQRLSRQAAIYKQLEQQAHCFAAHMLMPATSFASCPHRMTPHGLLPERETWGVSVSAMARRCRDLHMMTDEQYQNFMIDLSRLGWRTGEPGDESMPPEQPQLLRKAINHCMESGFLKWETWSLNIGLPTATLKDLAGLTDSPVVPSPPQSRPSTTSRKLQFSDLLSEVKSHRSLDTEESVSFKIADYR